MTPDQALSTSVLPGSSKARLHIKLFSVAPEGKVWEEQGQVAQGPGCTHRASQSSIHRAGRLGPLQNTAVPSL